MPADSEKDGAETLPSADWSTGNDHAVSTVNVFFRKKRNNAKAEFNVSRGRMKTEIFLIVTHYL